MRFGGGDEERGASCRVADWTGVEVDGVIVVCVCFYMNVFPETFFQCGAGFHLIEAQVLATFEKLGLPPSAIHSFTILGGCWDWGRGRGPCGGDGERSGGLRGGGVEALTEGDWRETL